MDCAGFWVHVDVDVLDPAVMSAVDAPEPGGIAFAELEQLLAGLVDTPHCLGAQVTVFDPDYDTDGAGAADISAALVAGLARAGAGRSEPEPASVTRPRRPRRRPSLDTEAVTMPTQRPASEPVAHPDPA